MKSATHHFRSWRAWDSIGRRRCKPTLYATRTKIWRRTTCSTTKVTICKAEDPPVLYYFSLLVLSLILMMHCRLENERVAEAVCTASSPSTPQQPPVHRVLSKGSHAY
jgi:hypothetical protein